MRRFDQNEEHIEAHRCPLTRREHPHCRIDLPAAYRRAGRLLECRLKKGVKGVIKSVFFSFKHLLIHFRLDLKTTEYKTTMSDVRLSFASFHSLFLLSGGEKTPQRTGTGRSIESPIFAAACGPRASVRRRGNDQGALQSPSEFQADFEKFLQRMAEQEKERKEKNKPLVVERPEMTAVESEERPPVSLKTAPPLRLPPSPTESPPPDVRSPKKFAESLKTAAFPLDSIVCRE